MDYTTQAIDSINRYYNHSAFKSYDDVTKWFTKARSPTAGRPFGRWARVYFSPSTREYTFNVHNVSDILKITPDNKVVFIASADQIRKVGHTLTANLSRVIPAEITRAGTLRYKVQSIAGARNAIHNGSSMSEAFKSGYEMWEGLTLDLETGLFINGKADAKTRVLKDKRSEWLKALRNFKRSIKVRNKLGALDYYCKLSDRHVPLPTGKAIELLYTAIKTNDISDEFLRTFADGTPRWGGLRYGHQIVQTIEAMLRDLSVPLREKFGVFSEE